MSKAVAFSNNDIALLAWNFDNKIERCLGFAIHRIDTASGERKTLPAWVGFKGQSNKEWKPRPTTVWPIQKFNWRDLTGTRGASYEYEIVPMVGEAGKLDPRTDLALKTNPVRLTPERGSMRSYFNRGILATQHLAHQIEVGPSGLPNYRVLRDRIDQPGDTLRNGLAGQMIEALSFLLARARDEGGTCYAALYELSDPELVQMLIGSPFMRLILSNAGKDDETNDAARQTLKDSGVKVIDRMLGSGHIGHNKFVVYADRDGKPQAVLTGSTNWTATGLCGQTNNALIIESPELAVHYHKYWRRLSEDGDEQGADFRKANHAVREAVVDGSPIDLWFSPNTRRKTKPADAPAPSDMKEVFDVMEEAKKGILFLAFQPGTPSIVDKAKELRKAKPELFIRGAATDPNAVDRYYTELFHRSGEDPAKVLPPKYEVVGAAAIRDPFAFWQAELLKSSPSAHAIIHDKIVVVDPLTPDCRVITGSHNLGYRASYNNDENLLLLKGNRGLAEAYAVHVMDVYDHYRWRYTIQKKKKKAWTGLDLKDTWQDKYFKVEAIKEELAFWI